MSKGLDRASAQQREQLHALLPPIDEVIEEELAFQLARDAARRKDRPALLVAAKKACALGKDDSDFDDDFDAFADDREFAAAIGRDPDKKKPVKKAASRKAVRDDDDDGDEDDDDEDEDDDDDDDDDEDDDDDDA